MLSRGGGGGGGLETVFFALCGKSNPLFYARPRASAASEKPMGPTEILEKATVASGESLMTSAGTPEVVAQVPRATPGCAGGALAAEEQR